MIYRQMKLQNLPPYETSLVPEEIRIVVIQLRNLDWRREGKVSRIMRWRLISHHTNSSAGEFNGAVVMLSRIPISLRNREGALV